MVKMYSLAGGANCYMAVEMSVAQMLKLHLSFMNVSAVVIAGADGLIPLPCFGCC